MCKLSDKIHVFERACGSLFLYLFVFSSLSGAEESSLSRKLDINAVFAVGGKGEASCALRAKSSTEHLKEINDKFRQTFGHGPGVHDPIESKVVNDIFKDQARETLCEMIAVEALSSVGWHGDSTKTEPPEEALALAKTFGLGNFFKTLRAQAQVKKAEIRSQFSAQIEAGLAAVAKKKIQFRNGNKTEKQKALEGQMLEEAYRLELPYANHPYFRDYYNRVIDAAFQGPVHIGEPEVDGRIKAANARLQSTLRVDLASTRKSLEVEAKVYTRMQNLFSSTPAQVSPSLQGYLTPRGKNGAYDGEYWRLLGQLGAFSTETNSEKENKALRALNEWYGSPNAEVSEVAASVAELGVGMIPVAGDAISAGIEMGRLQGQVQACYPEYPMGLRYGACESLSRITQNPAEKWSVDFFGSIPEADICAWKMAAQAGAVVVAAVPIVKYVRKKNAAKGAIKIFEAVKDLEKTSAAEVSSAARSRSLPVVNKTMRVGAHRSPREMERALGQLKFYGQSGEKLRNEIHDLILKRNNLATYLRKEPNNRNFSKLSEELSGLEQSIATRKGELQTAEARVVRPLRTHNRSLLEKISENPGVGKNPHLKEHFYPDLCLKSEQECEKFLRDLKSQRKNKITTFFSKNVRIEELLEVAEKSEPIKVVHNAAPLTTTSHFETLIDGKRSIFAIIVCQNPKSCSNSAFGEIETIFPICGAGVTQLLGVRLSPGSNCH